MMTNNILRGEPAVPRNEPEVGSKRSIVANGNLNNARRDRFGSLKPSQKISCVSIDRLRMGEKGIKRKKHRGVSRVNVSDCRIRDGTQQRKKSDNIAVTASRDFVAKCH